MLARWNDFGFGDFDRELAVFGDLRRELDRFFQGYERGYESAGQFGAGTPRIGVVDAGSELQVRAELPGFSEKDLSITVEQGSLTIRGKRSAEVPEGYSVHRQERGEYAFARSFTLPSRIDTEKVRAALRDGVLELTLPKAAEEQPRQIQVKVG